MRAVHTRMSAGCKPQVAKGASKVARGDRGVARVGDRVAPMLAMLAPRRWQVGRSCGCSGAWRELGGGMRAVHTRMSAGCKPQVAESAEEVAGGVRAIA